VQNKITASAVAHVTKEHQASYPDPLVVKSGDELTIGKKDTQWPAFVWCTNEQGISGWVPEKYLDRQGDRGIAQKDYSTAELTITVGEKVVLEREDSGWYWVTNQSDQSGWVPVENVAIDQNTTATPWFLWATLVALLIVAIGLTIYSDQQLTGDTPNLQFYILVPALDILGTAVVTFGIARLLRQPLAFSHTLVVITGASIIMQFAEIIEKGVYYYVWQYPGMLYFVFNFLLWLALVVYGFVRWAGLRWQTALTLAFFGFLGGLLVVGIVINFLGIATPGS
jgi:hypothetical protein